MHKYLPSLSSLPAELLALVLEELPYTNLMTCERVSKQFRKLIKDSAALQYKIDLAAHAMDDIPSSTLSTAAKRDMLVKHTHAMQEWSDEYVIQKTIPLLEGPLWELCGGVLAQSDGRRDLDFWQLPSKIRGVSAKEWSVTVDFDTADFTLDPSQDLLVAVEVRNETCHAHLLSVSTGQSHKAAAIPHLTFPLPHEDFPGRSYHLRICGDYVGIIIRVFDLVSDRPHTVFGVSNWKTGESKLLTSYWSILSFAFLDTNHILILRSLDSPEPTIPGQFLTMTVAASVLDFARPVAPNELNEKPSCPCVTLQLPPIAERWEIWHAEVVCDPSPGCASSAVCQPSSATDRDDFSFPPPFHVTRSDRIVVIRINGVDTLFEANDSLDVFVHASSLVGLLNSHMNPGPTPPLRPVSLPPTPASSPRAAAGALPKPWAQANRRYSARRVVPILNEDCYDLALGIVLWDVWGPSLTRVLTATVPACVWCYPGYGMRFVGQEKGYVTIYDFNPLAISKTLLETSEGSPRTRYGSVPTADGGELIASEGTHSGLLLEEPVRSSLPYRKFKTNLRIEAGQFIMLNEDSILLVRENSKEFRIVSI